MRLITELNEDVQVLMEATSDGGKKYFIEGIFLQAGIPNRNRRVYPVAIMEAEVDRYTREKIKKNRSYGELEHPQGPKINLDRVSHMIKELKQDGNNWIGKAQLSEDTDCGRTAIGLIKLGANLGVSSRGLGSLKNRNGLMEVQNDFWIATAADIVSDPSAPEAFVNGLLEGVEWINEGGIWHQRQIQEAKDALNTAYRNPNKELFEEVGINLFHQFMSTLRSPIS
jgi:hypothetical protein